MMTEGQQLALEQLGRIVGESDYDLEVLETIEPGDGRELLCIIISVFCGGFEKKRDGLPLRERERFRLYVTSGFPITPPMVFATHNRFAGFPHVQWKRYLCLYQSTDAEWVPYDGMFGFISRFGEWLKKAAKNELDMPGGPLHPPVTYTKGQSSFILVPRKDTPVVSSHNWVGFGRLEEINKNALAITEWIELSGKLPEGIHAAVILLDSPMPFEFPDKVSDLLIQLKERGLEWRQVLCVMQFAVMCRKPDEPGFLVIGAPMRGIRGAVQLQQHLTAWEIDTIVAKALRLSLTEYSSAESLRKIGQEVVGLIEDWAKVAEIRWCRIYEDRPEIVTRRDDSTPIAQFAGKTVSIWGCGALGAHVALSLAQAGVHKLILRDNKGVTPGVLLRQPYRFGDIGTAKVDALESRLKEMQPDVIVETKDDNIKTWLQGGTDWTENADLVIDCTASNGVHYSFESAWMKNQRRVPVMSMIISGTAREGIVLCIGNGHSGGIYDVYRKALIGSLKRGRLKKFADAFFPKDENRVVFQPEPGCSEVTFVGSAADSASMSNTLLNLAAGIFKQSQDAATAYFLSQAGDEDQAFSTSIEWQADHVCADQLEGYEIRVSGPAWNEVQAVIQDSSRTNGRDVETGGLLFGKRDDVLKIVWIDEACGPPSDSELHRDHFICGIEGTADIAAAKKERTRGLTCYTGMWHTHPSSLPFPSCVDVAGMGRILIAPETTANRNLLLIARPGTDGCEVGAFMFKKEDFQAGRLLMVLDTRRLSAITKSRNSHRKIGLALSGGGSRAIAFHLGCMRALHDRELLDEIEVISTVSGGSVIGAMYAYSDCSFEEFEERVSDLLRKGLLKSIVKEFFTSDDCLHEIANHLIKRPIALCCRAAGYPVLTRSTSRTSSFRRALANELFHDTKITDVKRDGLHIVINATELQTGTAFRFGNKESGCWRFGKISGNQVNVADAVAASAAYPALLPAIDIKYLFEQKGSTAQERVVLTDGGVFDNLGVTCMEPGKSSAFSTNVFKPDYIICCNAGYGTFSGNFIPFAFFTRMTQTVLTSMRKVQDVTMKRLHELREAGEIKGFILPYLGQLDHRLPYRWPDLVNRGDVDYPTNFNAMRQADIEKISRRGQQLTRLLIDYYHPEL